MQCDRCGCRDIRLIKTRKTPLNFNGIRYLMTHKCGRCRACGTMVRVTTKTIEGGKIET